MRNSLAVSLYEAVSEAQQRDVRWTSTCVSSAARRDEASRCLNSLSAVIEVLNITCVCSSKASFDRNDFPKRAEVSFLGQFFF